MKKIGLWGQGVMWLAWLMAPAAVLHGDGALRAPVVDYPPYAYVDDDGRAVGIVPSLLREVASRLDRQAEFLPANPRAALRGVQLGRFDLDVVGRTAESAEEYQFIPTVLFHYQQVLLARPGLSPSVHALEDLAGRTVAVRVHDAAHALLGRYPSIERITVPDYETGLRLVADAHADFFLGNRDVCLHLIATGRAPSLRPALSNIMTVPACFALSREATPQLVREISGAAAGMARDGTLDRLTATWLGGEFNPPLPPTWVQRHVRWLAGAVLGTVGLLVGFILLLRSLVQQRTRRLLEAQSSLRASEERYRQIFNTASEAILIIDPEGTIQACSDQAVQIYGYNPEELIGQSIRRLFSPDAEHKMRKNLAYLSEHGSRVHEAEHIRKDGQRIQVELSERIILLEKDPVIVSCATDITGRKQAEEALRESQERLNRLQRMEMAALIAGQIAHDFNNLLSPLTSLPDLIKEELPMDSRARQDLDLIRMSAQRMGEISQQLLTLGRRGNYAQHPLDLNRVVEEALGAVRGRLPRDIELSSRLAEGELAINGGVAQLLRCISNLLWNAVEAMPEGGRLEVWTGQRRPERAVHIGAPLMPGEYALLVVRDTGVGIPESVQEKIFEPFYTTKQTTRQRGQGLGLSVVHAVVTDHRGCIDVDSLPGRGTTFSLYFPLCREPIADEPARSTVHGTERILVVDDDQLQIDVTARVLSSLGYSVVGAQSGEEALSLFGKQGADLVILDMVMGNGMDGAETFRRMREVRPDQPAIFVTGYAEAAVMEQASQLAGGIILRKPMDGHTLARAIRAQLDGTNLSAGR